jgi:hypothetical protein
LLEGGLDSPFLEQYRRPMFRHVDWASLVIVSDDFAQTRRDDSRDY